MYRLRSLLILSALLAFSGCAHSGVGAGFERYTLANGMTVLLQPEHGTPVVAMNVWVHVGSKDEDDATRGLAHIQEHMLFQGTATYGSGTIFKTIQDHGGDFNAYTNYDETVYHIVLPAEKTRTGLSILSSMMHEATIDPALLKKELEVVMEEFRRASDDPASTLYEALFHTAFTQHPYRFPIIGYKDTIENTTPEAVKAFYSDWYVPGNMTLVLVGDFDTQVMKMIVNETFGAMPEKTNPKRAIPPDPAQTERRVKVTHGAFDNVRLALGFRNTSLRSPDTPALDMLYTLLGSGDSSRLVRSLREDKKLVFSISTYSQTPEDEGLGLIGADLTADHVGEALAEILHQVYALRHERITDEEMQKMKISFAAQKIYEQDSYEGIAESLGAFQVLAGDATEKERYLARMQSLTAEDLRVAAERYFIDDHLTISLLYPESETDGLSEEDIGRIAERAARENIVSGVEIVAPMEGAITLRERDDASGVTRVQFSNGMTLLVREQRAAAMFSYDAMFRGGLRVETPAINGIGNMASQMLVRGTITRTQQKIAEGIDAINSSMTPDISNNGVSVSGYSLREYGAQTLELLTDVLMHSTFPPEQLETVRTLTLDAIRQKNDDPSYLTDERLYAALYGPHPYGFTYTGPYENVSALSLDQVRAHAGQYFVPENLVLTIVGDVDTDVVVRDISATLGAWTVDGAPALPEVAKPVFPTKPVVTYLASPKQQTSLSLGFPGISIDHADRYAAEVLGQILGGTSGRLFLRLRDREGLAYVVSATQDAQAYDPGVFSVSIGCDPAKAQTALRRMREELSLIVDEGVTPDEVESAKSFLAGSFPIALQSLGAQAASMTANEVDGVGYETLFQYVQRMQSVTEDDVERVARMIIHPDGGVLSVVGPNPVR